ncbi:hypothetical protein [Bacillus sp. PS06]|uniref:hypothetical protein n=1 Tax=Bacillus sp. PS06 TaxID=2764176 RepID=UPI00177F22C7|nr:hypothetical protein [Bacillus sp. PS06]MBD8070206.1 hypothetical protein [Bacillus sp. PS06]
MNSLITKTNVINEIDGILNLTSQLNEKVHHQTNQMVNECMKGHLEEIARMAGELRKIDLRLNERGERGNKKKQKNQPFIYKLSY